MTDKIKMTEKAYTAVTNIKRLGTAMYVLRDVMSIGVIDEEELKKIRGQLSRWQADLFCIVEAPPEEERKGE